MPQHNTNSFDKVAFLALTYSDFECSYIWEQFFNPQYEHLFNLYIHNKYPMNGKLSEYCLSETIETGWGKFSLVEATFLLLEEAYKDENNQRFVLISDSHLPLHPMPEMCRKLKNQKKLDLNFLQQSENVFFKIIQEEFKYQGSLFKHSQWSVLTRENVKVFLETKNKYFSILKDIMSRHQIECLIFDEFYFGLVATLENIPYEFANNCHVEFKKQNPQYLIDLGVHSMPFIYTSINHKFLDHIASKKLFLRKICDKTRFVGKGFWFDPQC